MGFVLWDENIGWYVTVLHGKRAYTWNSKRARQFRTVKEATIRAQSGECALPSDVTPLKFAKNKKR
jgi:hypothetical protein